MSPIPVQTGPHSPAQAHEHAHNSPRPLAVQRSPLVAPCGGGSRKTCSRPHIAGGNAIPVSADSGGAGRHSGGSVSHTAKRADEARLIVP